MVIENKDALSVIKDHDSKDTLFYVDPPYVAATRVAIEGYRCEMTDGEHQKLSETLRNVKGMVVLSGYSSPLYDQLFDGWRCAAVETHGDSASKRTEVLWFSPNCGKPVNQLF